MQGSATRYAKVRDHQVSSKYKGMYEKLVLVGRLDIG